jgi:hypothetical protein
VTVDGEAAGKQFEGLSQVGERADEDERSDELINVASERNVVGYQFDHTGTYVGTVE